MKRIAAALLLTAACATAPSYRTLPDRASLNLPYSDAVRAGNLLFLAGTIGAPPGSRDVVPGGIVPETRQTLENIKRNLETHGSSIDRVTRCTVILVYLDDFEPMNTVWREYFPQNKPARTTFFVTALARGARVEIECTAVVR
ncbi:MAG TPA: RidA family protein [Thermoanaerobaculia bacterium]|nr:RidA family protein [Thermoanaerobaculia bacterium]